MSAAGSSRPPSRPRAGACPSSPARERCPPGRPWRSASTPSGPAPLCELPVTCLKDTGGDAVAATELIQRDGPTLLNGWDTLTFAALAAGARAVVWGAASIVPEPCVELHRLLIDEIDLPAARELWARLWPLCQFLEGQSYPAAVKAACALMGDATGPVRAPLLALDAAATAELPTLVERARRSRDR